MEPLDNAIRQVFNDIVERSPAAAKPLFEKMRDTNHVMVTGTTREETKAAYADYRHAKAALELLADTDTAVGNVFRQWEKETRAAKESFWRHSGPT